ncbi:dimethylamine monooxygenase subunit DmmA family protein [Enterobacterales bacterium AE_CKDN230030158-1A_HGKHYDSX7]
MSETILPDSAPPLPSLPLYQRPPSQAVTGALLVLQSREARQAAAQLAGVGETLLASEFASPVALQQALLERLLRASVGQQLLLCGDEAFVWPLHALARNAGLEADEIHLLRHGESRRAVYCVHCATLQHGDGGEQHDCRSCGVRLEVRRHFSRRLGAYLGVCADADQPYAEARP